MWSMKKEGMKESREMYLKAIYNLGETHSGNVRHIDIAEHLNISKPSVSRAISLLKEDNLIEISSGKIKLTNLGQEEAKKIDDRYKTIVKFLKVNTDANDETINMDACQIEHVISDELYNKMKDNISIEEMV